MLVLHPQTTTGAVIALDGSPLRELGSIPVLTHLSGHCMFKALLEDEFSSLLNVFTKFRVASDRVINYIYLQEGIDWASKSGLTQFTDFIRDSLLLVYNIMFKYRGGAWKVQEGANQLLNLNNLRRSFNMLQSHTT